MNERYKIEVSSKSLMNYWIYTLCPQSGILVTRKYNISESEYHSYLEFRTINKIHKSSNSGMHKQHNQLNSTLLLKM